MTPELRSRLKSLGLSGRGFALLTATHPNTVQGWGNQRSKRGVQDEPRWAWLLVDAWEAAPDALAGLLERVRTRLNHPATTALEAPPAS